MKIPHKIRIKSRISYEIVWVDRFDDEHCLGECRGDVKQIAILKNQSDKQTFQTFLHEVLHAIEFEHGISLPHKSIHVLDAAIYKILKLNKLL